MRSGGFTTAPAVSSGPEEYRRLSGEFDAQQAVVEEAGAAFTNASELVQQRREEESSQRAEGQHWLGAVRAGEDRCRAAGSQVDQYLQSCKSEFAALAPGWAQCNAEQGLALWQDRDYQAKCRDQILQACLEKLCEDRNFGGEALLAWGRACLKMMAAILGNDLPLSVELARASYLRVPNVLHNAAPATFAHAASTADALAAKEREIAGRMDDPFFANKAKEEEIQLEQDKARHQKAIAGMARAKAALDAATAARDAARAEYGKAQANLRAIDAKRREVQARHA